MEVSIKVTPHRLQRNIELWSKWDPKHAVQLQYLDTEDYEFCQTEKGELNLCKKTEDGSIFFHNPKGAQKEAEEWFSKINSKQYNLIYIYGVGLGYTYLAAKKWLHEHKDRQIVFLEDDLGVICKLFETDVGGQILRDKKVRISYFHSVEHDKMCFSSLFWRFLETSFIVEPSPIYAAIKKNTFDDLSHKLVYDASVNNAVLSEYYDYGILFYRNFYHILLNLEGSYLGTNLYGKFEKIPAIICGAGPSLQKHFEALRQLGTHALIFAGGSSINALNSADIMPHFGAGVDPNPAQYSRYLTNKAYELPFFFRTRLQHQAFDLLHGPKLLLTGSGGYSAADYFERELELPEEEAFEGFNVINLLIDVARRMGCDPIILVGMDLGYTNKQSYAPGVIENYNVGKQLEESKVDDEYPILKQDIYGKPLYTLWKWVAESQWIEEHAEEFKEQVTILNATEGGLGFGSVPNVSLQESIEKYCANQIDLHSLVHTEVENSTYGFSKEKILHHIHHMRASLKECIRLLTILIKETKVIKKHLREKREVPDYMHTGAAALAEEELSNEPGFNAVLVDFNDMYNRILQAKLEEIRQTRSEVSQMTKKMQIQEKKYKFLRDAAKANLMCIDFVLKEDEKSGKISAKRQ